MQLPSKFQIGDTVTVKRESGKVSMPKAKVTGVQFTESKVRYIVEDLEGTTGGLVDSELVEEVHQDQQPPSE